MFHLAPRSLTMHELAAFRLPGLLDIRIEGHERPPREGPILFLANRCSLLDAGLITLAAGRPVEIPTCSSLFWLPPIRELAERLHAVPLVPEDAATRQEAGKLARVLERGRPVVVFGDFQLERRPEGPRLTVAPEFLRILLETASPRIPVVPARFIGEGRQLRVGANPFLTPLLKAGTLWGEPQAEPRLFARNALRLGRPVYWREGQSGMTLEAFRRQVESSLGALF